MLVARRVMAQQAASARYLAFLPQVAVAVALCPQRARVVVQVAVLVDL